MAITAFLTDSTLCIGCKACEVACKEWNELPADGLSWSGASYDNTESLGHATWRHVKFVENETAIGLGGNASNPAAWAFSSDVCKHCANAGCLEACPTGSIVRTEFGGVFVQPDICNGCSYCVPSCPFGVIEQDEKDGRAFKCTFCYDRQKVGLEPACAKVCPTESIRFGELEELRVEARERVEELKSQGLEDACVYDPVDTSVGGIHSVFILRGSPEKWNLPPHPELPQHRARRSWGAAAIAAGAMVAGALLVFLGDSRRF